MSNKTHENSCEYLLWINTICSCMNANIDSVNKHVYWAHQMNISSGFWIDWRDYLFYNVRQLASKIRIVFFFFRFFINNYISYVVVVASFIRHPIAGADVRVHTAYSPEFIIDSRMDYAEMSADSIFLTAQYRMLSLYFDAFKYRMLLICFRCFFFFHFILISTSSKLIEEV